MAVPFEQKPRYTVDDLRRIMTILRSDDGCPWDREQTHRSIRSSLVEETYEALEAIDNDDDTALCEELGDVLLQVVFHAEMAQEDGRFSFDDVADGICKKLIVRHPHVFGDVKADDADTVLKNWDSIKRKTKGDTDQSFLLANLPKALPALMRAAKVQERAARVGFDFPHTVDAFESLESELEEVRQSLADFLSAYENDVETFRADVEEELGDLLFSAVNVARFVRLDAEQTLNAATDKFIRRFAKMEAYCKELGHDVNDLSLDELNDAWDSIKHTD